MKYRIKRLAIDSTEFVDVTDVDMHRIQAAASSLRAALFLEEKFDWVVEGYLNFESHLLQATLRNLTCGPVDDRWLVKDRH